MSHTPHILVIVSTANEIPLREGGTHETGIFLGELTEPAEAMREAGFKLTFASPGGKEPTVDKHSYDLIYWGFSQKRVNYAQALYETLRKEGLAHPLVLEELAENPQQLAQFDGLFVPGGHAPMVDLLHRNHLEGEAPNEQMGRILQFFHDSQRPTGLICHAPAALAAAPQVDGKWIYQGYRMTTITMLSEFLMEDMPLMKVIPGHLKQYPTQVLKAAGAILDQTNIPMRAKVVEDRELITGQDPFSAQLFAERFVEKVKTFCKAQKA
jgi:putative intracellular protease/amidase